MLAGAVGIGPRLPASMRLLAKIDAVHPREPHWYLAVLGVEPPAVRRYGRCDVNLDARG
jgi:hypothetical protein